MALTEASCAFIDTETTTGLSPADEIIELACILTDLELKEIGRWQGKFKPGRAGAPRGGCDPAATTRRRGSARPCPSAASSSGASRRAHPLRPRRGAGRAQRDLRPAAHRGGLQGHRRLLPHQPARHRYDEPRAHAAPRGPCCAARTSSCPPWLRRWACASRPHRAMDDARDRARHRRRAVKLLGPQALARHGRQPLKPVASHAVFGYGSLVSPEARKAHPARITRRGSRGWTRQWIRTASTRPKGGSCVLTVGRQPGAGALLGA